ncbi:MAG: hypothetical protein WAO08_31140 [Hyphomicrobiaceae bacterium]
MDDASTVHKHGAPELVEAVKDGEVSVKVAADLTHAPKEVQREVVESVKRELDDKGKPSPAVKKQLRTAAAAAKASSGRKGKSVPKAKADGEMKTTRPPPNFKDAILDFASAADHLFSPRRTAVVDDSRMPAAERKQLLGYLLSVIKRASDLKEKLEAHDQDRNAGGEHDARTVH